jgi:uncharacterized protein (DUF433 family)
MSHAIAPHIELRQNRAGQKRAYLAGTRVRVQDISSMAEIRGLSADQIVQALPHLSLGQVHAALSYYFDHRDEILKEFNEDEAYVREARATAGPSLVEQRRVEMEQSPEMIGRVEYV